MDSEFEKVPKTELKALRESIEQIGAVLDRTLKLDLARKADEQELRITSLIEENRILREKLAKLGQL